MTWDGDEPGENDVVLVREALKEAVAYHRPKIDHPERPDCCMDREHYQFQRCTVAELEAKGIELKLCGHCEGATAEVPDPPEQDGFATLAGAMRQGRAEAAVEAILDYGEPMPLDDICDTIDASGETLRRTAQKHDWLRYRTATHSQPTRIEVTAAGRDAAAANEFIDWSPERGCSEAIEP